MKRIFHVSQTITVHFNQYRKRSVVFAFGDQNESARFFLSLEDTLNKLVEDAAQKYRSVLIPVSVSQKMIPLAGLRVRFRMGECYGSEIDWSEPHEGTLVVQHDTNSERECGVNIQEVGGTGFAGFDDRTKTYWRYREDSIGENYREHCLQVLEVL